MAAIKKILFISYDGMTDPLGQSQVIPYLAGLSALGYRFTILSADKPARYNKNKTYVRELLLPFNITWVSVPYHKDPAVFSSIYDYYQMRRKAEALHKAEHFDMVHTRPGIPTLIALYLKRKYSIKFFNDIRGFWADERVDGGMWDLKNPIYNKIYRFFKQHEYECIREADHNSCLTYKGREEIQSWKEIPNQPISLSVIPCCADLELFDPGKIDPKDQAVLRKELNIAESDFVISYLGSLGGWYLTNDMMRFCTTLSNKVKNAKFLFITPHSKEDVEAFAIKNQLPLNKIVVKLAKRNEVPLFLSLSNYSMFFIKPCYSKMSSSPTKHGEIMAMGIPLITNSGVGDIDEIVERYNGGIVLKDLGEEAFYSCAEKVAGMDIYDGNHIRNSAFAYYSLQKGIEKYALAYQQVFLTVS